MRKVLRPLIPHRDVPYNPGNVINDIPVILGFSEDINYHGAWLYDDLPRWFTNITSPIQSFMKFCLWLFLGCRDVRKAGRDYSNQRQYTRPTSENQA